MPPKNDILKDFCIRWTTREGEVIAKVKYPSILDDGFTCTCTLNDIQKEKKMNKKMNKKMKDVNCVCIIQDGNEVKAVAMKNVNKVLLDGHNVYTDSDFTISSSNKIVATAKAKCCPNDIFDFNIGAKLAMDRLYEGYDMTPKPKRKPYNGKIFVQRFPGSVLLPNHIYNVKNGVIINIPLSLRYEPFIFTDMTDAEMSCAVYKNVYSVYASDVTAACCSGCYFVKE